MEMEWMTLSGGGGGSEALLWDMGEEVGGKQLTMRHRSARTAGSTWEMMMIFVAAESQNQNCRKV